MCNLRGTAGRSTVARGTAGAFDHIKAVNYARKHWNTACHDGFVAVKSGTPGTKFGFPFVKAVPGAHFEGDPEEIATVGAGIVVLEFHEDCTHFVSCCVGRPGGGLSMPNPFFGPYGIVSAPQFLKFIAGRGQEKQGISDLNGGDVICYFAGSSIRHIALYIGEGKIACHSMCRIDAPFDGISFAKRRYFHIMAD